MLERTFSIIKPDAVKRNLVGVIDDMIEKAGFKIIDKLPPTSGDLKNTETRN